MDDEQERSESLVGEELPERRRSPRRRALLIAAAVLLGLAVAAGIVVRVMTSTSSTTEQNPTVTASPSATPTSSTPTTSTPRFLIGPPRNLPYLARLTRAELSAAHERCPPLAPTCTTTGETPIAVSDAVRDVLPGASHFVAVSDIAYPQNSATTTSGPMLAYRRLSARTNSVRVTVEVRQAEESDGNGGISLLRGGVAIVREQRVVGTRVVELQASAARSDALDVERLRRLVTDARVLATG